MRKIHSRYAVIVSVSVSLIALMPRDIIGQADSFTSDATLGRVDFDVRAWEEAATLVVRPSDRLQWNQFPWPEAISVFARGLGATHTGDLDAAEQSITRLSDLVEEAERSGEAVFVAPIEIMRLELRAWYEKESGNLEQAVELMKEAMGLEERTPKHPVIRGAILPA